MNDDSTEKRMAGDYEVIQAVHIGDREVVLGENPQDDNSFHPVPERNIHFAGRKWRQLSLHHIFGTVTAYRPT